MQINPPHPLERPHGKWILAQQLPRPAALHMPPFELGVGFLDLQHLLRGKFDPLFQLEQAFIAAAHPILDQKILARWSADIPPCPFQVGRSILGASAFFTVAGGVVQGCDLCMGGRSLSPSRP